VSFVRERAAQAHYDRDTLMFGFRAWLLNWTWPAVASAFTTNPRNRRVALLGWRTARTWARGLDAALLGLARSLPPPPPPTNERIL